MGGVQLGKQHTGCTHWRPLEAGTATVPAGTVRLAILDGAGRTYVDRPVRRPGRMRFTVRGSAGSHRVQAFGADGSLIVETSFCLVPHTDLDCDRGVYARFARRVWSNLRGGNELPQRFTVGGGLQHLCVQWLRDHTYTLKALRHFWNDVTSGTTLFLDQQRPDGMIWDDISLNRTRAPSWFGEALGRRYHGYADDMRWIFRRIPIEADVEYIAVESVHHAWKASGDDAWMAAQLPRLEKAVAYTTGSPLRWSRRHGLVKRAYTMDSWDFKHPDPRIGGGGDHRCLADGRTQPFFLFHGDNSGLYAAYWRLAEMYRALGRQRDAEAHQERADALRARANRLLWKDPIYAHMVPDRPMPGLKARVGDDDRRISLSLPYTVNRGLPDHAMAVRIIDEYRRRGRAQRRTSFAEWWAMDPLYTAGQWGDDGGSNSGLGEYMNGSVSPLVAGELARAAFAHGREAYGADILRRLWLLSEADGGSIHDCYRRLPPGFAEPGMTQRQRPIDLRVLANVGLRHGATPGVPAWTGEGRNDMRNLPTGRQRWHEVDLAILDPAGNHGRSVIALGGTHPSSVLVPWKRRLGSLYVLHALAGGARGTVGSYSLIYADGSEHAFPLVAGSELSNWWNPQVLHDHRSPPQVGRIAWHGPNPVVRDVGLYLSGFTNPHPSRQVAAIRLDAAPGIRLMIAALTAGDGPARLPRGIRSYGLPAEWSQGAIHHAMVEGLAGIEDTDRAFAAARIAPRWSATEARSAEVCVHYPASDGYCAYRWRLDARRRRIEIDVTGSFTRAELRVLLPAGVRRATADDGTAVRIERIERSVYAVISLDALPTGPLRIGWN